jgi:hypothetical protein
MAKATRPKTRCWVGGCSGRAFVHYKFLIEDAVRRESIESRLCDEHAKDKTFDGLSAYARKFVKRGLDRKVRARGGV